MNQLFIKVLISFLMISEALKAQELKCGDRLPDISICNVINSTDGGLRLSDYKGKLLILDFWGTYCKSCIEAIPELEALQRKYDHQIQIVMVAGEKRERVLQFFKGKGRKMPLLPIITDDSLLQGMFPHLYKPHHVWIDESGVVKEITSGWNTNEQNVAAYLKKGVVDLAVKQDVRDYDVRLPMISEGNGRWLNRMEYYSYLSKTVPGLFIGDDRKKDGIVCNRKSVAELIRIAFEEGGRYDFEPEHVFFLNVRNKEHYVWPQDKKEYDAWMSVHCYNYELKVPAYKEDGLYKLMQDDMRRYFDVDIRRQKRVVKYKVLRPVSDLGLLKTKGGLASTNFWVMHDSDLLYMHNLPFEMFVSKLKFLMRSYYPDYPFENEAGFKGNADVMISACLFEEKDEGLLNRELMRYGLRIEERYKEADVLVVSNKQ